MLAFVRSHVNVKLTAALAITLCLVLGGLAGVYITVVNTLMAEQEARAGLLRDMNAELRAEVFGLQKKLIAIPLNPLASSSTCEPRISKGRSYSSQSSSTTPSSLSSSRETDLRGC